MRDCSNATMRERLPDLIHDRLTAAERAEVHAHLNTCAECRAELALLERVRSATRSPTVDAQRIVSALPMYRARSRWERAVRSRWLQAAAVAAIFLGGAVILTDSPVPVEEPAARPVAQVAPADTPTVAVDTSRSAPRRRPVSSEPATTELAVGELFDDLTDSELEALLDALGSMEAVTPVETEVVAPAVNREGE